MGEGGAIGVIHAVGPAAGGVAPALAPFAPGLLAELGDESPAVRRTALERLLDIGRRGIEIEALTRFEADAFQPVDHRIVERPWRVVFQKLGKAGELCRRVDLLYF